MFKSLFPFVKMLFPFGLVRSIDPLIGAAGISIGSRLIGSLLGGGGAPKVPREAQFARQTLLDFLQGPIDTSGLEAQIAAGGTFNDPRNPGQTANIRRKEVAKLREQLAKIQARNRAAEGLFPEQDILSEAFGAIQSRIQRQKEGATARAASLGIDPRSGLAENLRSGIQRGEAEAFGKTRSSVSIAKARARQQALNALLGLPSIPTGIDVPNVIAQGGQDISQLLLLKEFLG